MISCFLHINGVQQSGSEAVHHLVQYHINIMEDLQMGLRLRKEDLFTKIDPPRRI